VATCPPVGDWAFPSNHATIAGAAAAGLLLARPRPTRATWLVVPLAVMAAALRVVTGVHYPHDVLAGLLLGAAIAVAFVLGLAPLWLRAVGQASRLPRLGPVRVGPPPARPKPAAPPPTDSCPRRQ
jgi:membrane-associated phospholipid phosphatase